MIDKLDGVGAVLTGKLSMVELAGGGGYRFASASLTGPGLNPWDRTRWSGGSSSGSGAAVAAGLVPFAIGSETSGSIVTPASFCGVTALRPTYGLVSRYGAMALSWTLDKLGPVRRSRRGLRPDPAGHRRQGFARTRAPPARASTTRRNTRAPMKDLRVGYAPVDFTEWAEPAARPAFDAAIAVLKASGVQMVETKLPDFPYGAVLSTILNGEMGSIFEPLITSGKVDELADKPQIAGLKASLELPAKDYLKAMRLRRLIQDEVSQHLRRGRRPARARPRPASPPRSISPSIAAPAVTPPKDPGFRAIIPMGNLAGLPALVLPCGFAENMPVALQLVGVPFSENTLLAIGREFQSRTDWHHRRPPSA